MKDGEKKLEGVKVLPYLVSNVTEILDIEPEEEDGMGQGVDEDAAK